MTAWTNTPINNLTIPSNAGDGARIELNGDYTAIYEYNASNQLTGVWASVAGTDPVTDTAYVAGMTQINPATGVSTSIEPSGLVFASALFIAKGIVVAGTIGAGATLQSVLSIIPPNTGGGSGEINLFSRSKDGTSEGTFVQIQQDQAIGTIISGAIVQTDDGGAAIPKFVHSAVYDPTFTAGAATFAHGCAFTPTGCQITSTGTGTPGVTQVSYSQPISATDVTVQAYSSLGVAHTGAATLAITFWG